MNLTHIVEVLLHTFSRAPTKRVAHQSKVWEFPTDNAYWEIYEVTKTRLKSKQTFDYLDITVFPSFSAEKKACQFMKQET
jgi:hypothetical protein